jgi:hypothetical protein
MDINLFEAHARIATADGMPARLDDGQLRASDSLDTGEEEITQWGPISQERLLSGQPSWSRPNVVECRRLLEMAFLREIGNGQTNDPNPREWTQIPILPILRLWVHGLVNRSRLPGPLR